MSDLIDRQAIDEIKEIMTDISGNSVYVARMSYIRALPSVTPTERIQIGDLINMVEDLSDDDLDLLQAIIESEINNRCKNKGLDPEEVEAGGVAWYNFPNKEEGG